MYTTSTLTRTKNKFGYFYFSGWRKYLNHSVCVSFYTQSRNIKLLYMIPLLLPVGAIPATHSRCRSGQTVKPAPIAIKFSALTV